MELITKLGVNWQLLLAQIVNFMIVLGVLSYLVYRPLLNLLDERRERIRKSLEEAKRVEEESRKMDQIRQEQMKQIDEQSGVILSEARQKAEAIRHDLLEQARKEAQEILDRGRAQLQSERTQALDEMQGALGKIIVQLTEKLLQREFTPADQKKLLHTVEQSLPTLLK